MPEQPLHIAIIPDGNRRWAKARGLLAWNGHEKAIQNFRDISDFCRRDPRIGTLTVWCFSTENWKRDPAEVSKLMGLLETFIRRERSHIDKYKTRLLHSGRRDRLPPTLITLMDEVCATSKDYTDFTLHLAIDYGGKDEIIRAINKQQATSNGTSAVWDENTIRANLDHPELPDIDLIVRSSGEIRTSNFFLWQSTYAEWKFFDKYFPDFTVEDLKAAVDDFAKRTRRFGS